MSEVENQTDVAALTVQLLSAYLANNTVPSDDLAALIRSTRAALTETEAEPVEDEAPTHTPAVSVRKSLASPDHIISLIDGKPYKVLKRHLATHGLTPTTYRERYNLPASYPMVAPSFAAHRRAIAEKIGLGRKSGRGGAADEQGSVASDTPDMDAPKGRAKSAASKKAAGSRSAKAAAAPAASASVEQAVPAVDNGAKRTRKPAGAKAGGSERAPRRGGKLGLFSKDKSAPGAEGEAAAPAKGRNKGGKDEGAKRMARTPSASNDADTSADATDRE